MKGMTERQYDMIHNEGGEGYNPIREARLEAEWEAERDRPKTREERRDQLVNKIIILDCAIARECGTYDQAVIDDLRAQIHAIDAEIEAEFAAEWTIEVTQERRKEWNDMIRSGRMNNKHGRIDELALRDKELEQGWSMSDLRKAVAMHGL